MVDPKDINKKAQELLKSMKSNYDDTGNMTVAYFETLEKGIFENRRKRLAEEAQRNAPPKVDSTPSPQGPPKEPIVAAPAAPAAAPAAEPPKKQEAAQPQVQTPIEVAPQPKIEPQVEQPKDSIERAKLTTTGAGATEQPATMEGWTFEGSFSPRPGHEKIKYISADGTKFKEVNKFTVAPELVGAFKQTENSPVNQSIKRIAQMWIEGIEEYGGNIIRPDDNMRSTLAAAAKELSVAGDTPQKMFSSMRKLKDNVHKDAEVNRYLMNDVVFEPIKRSFAKRVVMTPDTRKGLIDDINVVFSEQPNGQSYLTGENLLNTIGGRPDANGKRLVLGIDPAVMAPPNSLDPEAAGLMEMANLVRKVLPNILKEVSTVIANADDQAYPPEYLANERMKPMGYRIGHALFNTYIKPQQGATPLKLLKNKDIENFGNRIAVAYVNNYLNNKYGMSVDNPPSKLAKGTFLPPKNPVEVWENDLSREEQDEKQFVVKKSGEIVVTTVEIGDIAKDHNHLIIKRNDKTKKLPDDDGEEPEDRLEEYDDRDEIIETFRGKKIGPRRSDY